MTFLPPKRRLPCWKRHHFQIYPYFYDFHYITVIRLSATALYLSTMNIAGLIDHDQFPFPPEAKNSKPNHRPTKMHFAVCGLHLRNHPLSHQLISAGAHFLHEALTAPLYKMYVLKAPNKPTKPGLVLQPGTPGTASLPVEVWNIPEASLGSLLSFVPSPLGFGTVLLADGKEVYGFTCEGWAADPGAAREMGLESEDITSYGGWASYAKEIANHQ